MSQPVELPNSIRKKITVLRSCYKLTQTDEKLVAFLSQNPREVIGMTAREFGEHCGVSVAAVSRLSRKMGFDRFTDLKLALSGSLSRPTLQYGSISPSDTMEERIRKVIHFDRESIADILEVLDPDQLRLAVLLLNEAGSVIFTGFGGSASVAYDCYHKFSRTGKLSEYIDDVHRLRIRCSVGKPSEVIVVCSSEGRDLAMNRTLAIGKDNGMRIIAITMFTQSPLTRLADVCLFTLAGSRNAASEALISRVASYAMSDLLYMEYYVENVKIIEEMQNKITHNMKELKK